MQSTADGRAFYIKQFSSEELTGMLLLSSHDSQTTKLGSFFEGGGMGYLATCCNLYILQCKCLVYLDMSCTVKMCATD